MSEWLKEHAWKAKVASDIKPLPRASTHTRSGTWPSRTTTRCASVNLDVLRGSEPDVSQSYHNRFANSGASASVFIGVRPCSFGHRRLMSGLWQFTIATRACRGRIRVIPARGRSLKNDPRVQRSHEPLAAVTEYLRGSRMAHVRRAIEPRHRRNERLSRVIAVFDADELVGVKAPTGRVVRLRLDFKDAASSSFGLMAEREWTAIMEIVEVSTCRNRENRLTPHSASS
jgi:hypothetical protein